MKKIKLAFIAMAILVSIGGAFATRSRIDCRYSLQYYQVGSSFVPAGEIGVNYVCEVGPGICTFYQVGSNYAACQTGTYFVIP